MFQSFTSTARPEQGPARLAALRNALADDGLDGFLVPRADAHQGEYVAASDERLAWLTGFTGSAGFAIVLRDIAGVFIDGRYRLQVREQTDGTAFTPVDWPETRPGDWLRNQIGGSAQIGFDPWLHTVGEIETLRKALAGTEITLVETENLIDRIWTDRPAPPCGIAFGYPETFSGQSADEKRGAMAAALREAGQRAAILTLPDSIAWLLNIRGADIPRVPVVHAFAVLHDDGRVDLFTNPAKLANLDLGTEVTVHLPEAFPTALARLDGPVRIDRQSAPVAVHGALTGAGVAVAFDRDPCILPKACKTAAELTAARAAHLRDGLAMVEFLAWLDDAAAALCIGGPGLSEIEVVKRLEACRTATGALQDISFDTICGSGPNGAIVHYRVTEDTDRALQSGELLLVDSGGQYLDGTTDITRTMAVGPAGEEERGCYTRVLQGLIAISRVRFPTGLAGRDLDALARAPLWAAGLDYGHGTGHGIGQYLSVHEGPQRLSRQGAEPLKPGMILSNEPGYYREGAFGIRLENLIVVTKAPDLAGGDPGRDMLSFETLTFVPFERRLIDLTLLSEAERDWIDSYHAECRERLAAAVSPNALRWLTDATEPL